MIARPAPGSRPERRAPTRSTSRGRSSRGSIDRARSTFRRDEADVDTHPSSAPALDAPAESLAQARRSSPGSHFSGCRPARAVRDRAVGGLPAGSYAEAHRVGKRPYWAPGRTLRHACSRHRPASRTPIDTIERTIASWSPPQGRPPSLAGGAGAGRDQPPSRRAQPTKQGPRGAIPVPLRRAHCLSEGPSSQPPRLGQ